jgi:HAE1 family hydrophobic/amphiphilic exporter-1
MNNLGQKSGDRVQFVFRKIYGPEAVSRFNMLKSVNVNGKSNPGFSSGDAIKTVQEVASTAP